MTVLAQDLRHSLYGSYAGVLTVALADGTQHKIGIGNFVEFPFWSCAFGPPRSDREFWTNSGGGVVIAKLQEGARAVDQNGEWVTLKPREHLLCNINIRGYSNRLECTVLDARDRQLERVEVDPQDARIVY